VVDQPPMYATQAGKTLYNSEIGWPTDAIAGGDLSANGSIASIPNTQILLDTWVCQANANISSGGTYDHGYFWFGMYHPQTENLGTPSFLTSFLFFIFRTL